MQITTIIISLVLVSLVQTALVTRIPKPKLSSGHSQNLHIAETPKHKSPEERRKFSLFPKSYMKYVISFEPIYEIATHKPIVHGTKKPLMKKLHFLDKKNKAAENETQQPITNAAHIEGNKIDVTPKVNIVQVSEEQSKEIVEEKSKKSNEKQNDNSEEQDNYQNDSSEIKTLTTDIANKKTPNLKDLILPPKSKPVDISEELSIEIIEEKFENSNENQNDNSEEEDKQQNYPKIKKLTPVTESEAKLEENNTKQNDNSKENTLQNNPNEIESPNLKDLRTKPVEDSLKNKIIEAYADENKKLEDDETPDWMEFIFIDPAHKPSEHDKNSSEDPEEHMTTEYYVEEEIVRVKRSSNVIEEENLASTVAGFKYTLKDTRLNNNVAFKNIHS